MVGPGQLTRNLSVEKMETSPGSSGDASSTVKIELNSFNEIERNEEIPSTFEYKSQEKADADSTAGVYKEFFDIFWKKSFLGPDLCEKMSKHHIKVISWSRSADRCNARYRNWAAPCPQNTTVQISVLSKNVLLEDVGVKTRSYSNKLEHRNRWANGWRLLFQG